MERSVLYLDPPAFCTTVEGLVAPALRSRPVVVAAPGADRATVLALSAEARGAGITRGMRVSEARKRCPDLIIRPPNPELYARASKALDVILRRYAPIIEPKGYGHAFLDLTGTGRLFGKAVDVAAKIQYESRERLGLPLAAGVAQNKLVSQAASEVAKGWTAGPSDRRTVGPPLLDVEPGTEAAFLAPEQVDLLPDLDPKIRTRLDEYQLDWIGEIQAITDDELAAVFGSPGRLLGAQARGIDTRPVLPPSVQAEFRTAHTLADDSNDLGVLHRILRRLTERLGSRLRARQLVARRLTLRLAYTDYATAKRAVALPVAALDSELWQAALNAFALANQRTVAIRAVGVSVDRFFEVDLQLGLWEVPECQECQRCQRCQKCQECQECQRCQECQECQECQSAAVPGAEQVSRQRDQSLQTAIDRIRTRWGRNAMNVGR